MTSTPQQPSKSWHITLWLAQGILASMFLMAGVMKSTSPIEELAVSVPWAADVPLGLVRFIGVCEFLGALGLILPSFLRIQPKLTVYAALALTTVMIFAMVFHISRGEYPAVGFNLMLGVVASFIAWGRMKKAPIEKRS